MLLGELQRKSVLHLLMSLLSGISGAFLSDIPALVIIFPAIISHDLLLDAVFSLAALFVG